jgi:hypothetical protein
MMLLALHIVVLTLILAAGYVVHRRAMDRLVRAHQAALGRVADASSAACGQVTEKVREISGDRRGRRPGNTRARTP